LDFQVSITFTDEWGPKVLEESMAVFMIFMSVKGGGSRICVSPYSQSGLQRFTECLLNANLGFIAETSLAGRTAERGNRRWAHVPQKVR